MRPPHRPRRRVLFTLGPAVAVAIFGLIFSLLPAVPAQAVEAAAPAGQVIAADEALAASPAGAGNAAAVAGAIRPATLVGFDPANLMSDAVFYDGAAMSSAEIQQFLEQQVTSCANDRCIRNLRASISPRPLFRSARTGNLVCNAIPGGTDLRVSEIIYRAQVACGISAKVILATLQKEQGLVTGRAPSAWNVQQAMGAYCPDTSPCDPAFAGIGAQILAGTTQLKTYRAAEFARQPGVHHIGWHPNAACGGTWLTIANYATAALYNYTPYQPNAAALRAGKGTGDGCSSYGNRNFYNDYTDWFGSTQVTNTALVAVGPHIYVVSAGRRYHITPSVWPAYNQAFGQPTAIAARYLDVYEDAGSASLFVLNQDTGAVSYLDGGQTHRFETCTLVAAWGGSCGALTRLSGADVSRVREGAPMTLFAALASNGATHRISGDTLVPLYGSLPSMANGGTAPYAAPMPDAVASRYRVVRAQFPSGSFVQQQGDGRVFLALADGRLLYLPSWSMAREFGLPAAVIPVPAGGLAGYADAGRLSAFVRCDGELYFAASGSLHPVRDAGFGAAALDGAACGALRVNDGPGAELFVRALGTPHVYHAREGVYRHVASVAQLIELNGSAQFRLVDISASTMTSLPKGAPHLVPGELVKSGSSPRVYFVNGNSLAHVSSFAVTSALGIASGVRSVPGFTAPETAEVLKPAVRCGETVYARSGGVFVPVQVADHTVLDPAACAALGLG